MPTQNNNTGTTNPTTTTKKNKPTGEGKIFFFMLLAIGFYLFASNNLPVLGLYLFCVVVGVCCYGVFKLFFQVKTTGASKFVILASGYAWPIIKSVGLFSFGLHCLYFSTGEFLMITLGMVLVMTGGVSAYNSGTRNGWFSYFYNTPAIRKQLTKKPLPADFGKKVIFAVLLIMAIAAAVFGFVAMKGFYFLGSCILVLCILTVLKY